MAGLEGRRGRHFYEKIEEGPQIRAGLLESAGRRPGLGVRVHDREVNLVRVRAEIDEQLIDLVEHLGRPGVAAVDLVDGDHHGQSARHRLLKDITRLGQGPFGRVDEQQNAVDQQQGPFDLAAEVGVPRRIHDIQPDAVVVDRRLLGQDRDALLTFEIHRVEDPVDQRLVRAEGACLSQHPIHQGGLAVVNVGDDRDVAQVPAHARVLGCVGDRGVDAREREGMRPVGHGRRIVAWRPRGSPNNRRWSSGTSGEPRSSRRLPLQFAGRRSAVRSRRQRAAARSVDGPPARGGCGRRIAANPRLAFHPGR